VTARLCASALAEWQFIDGFAVSQNIDLLDLPLGRFTNFIWWMMTREAQKSDVDKMRAKLWIPPVGTVEIVPQSPWSPENEQNAFAALKAGLGK
jgi:hypothetical protein